MDELGGEAAVDWARTLGRALRALRLNRHFPDWRQVTANVTALAASGTVRIGNGGLPAPREWARLRADHELGPGVLSELQSVELDALEAEHATRMQEKRSYLQQLADVTPLPVREVQVALRHRDGSRASYQVVVDRLDIATGTLARYTLILWDTPGTRISDGELALSASKAFADRLALLSTQDAALAFAVLRGEDVDVEEIVRGRIGPVVQERPGLELGQPALTAVLERVSVDLSKGVVDDPLLESITVPAADVDFGMSSRRKWAVARADQDTLRSWLRERGSRNLVYAW